MMIVDNNIDFYKLIGKNGKIRNID